MSKELNSNKLNGKDLINAGIFSADRSVAEYAKDIWNIKKVK